MTRAAGRSPARPATPRAGARRALQGGEKAFLVASDPQELWKGRTLAAVLPEATKANGNASLSLYRPRALFDDGRLFFNAADSLVPADANGNWDVYEYEPIGVGSCSASSAGAGSARTGDACVSLISSGTGEEEAGFADASANGADVFFYTPARLAVTDTDRVTDIYDARVDGEPASLPSTAECQGEACQPPGAAPGTQTPSSATFRGPGNVRQGGGQSRCAKPARRAARLARRAKKLRRAASRSGALGLRRRAKRLAAQAKRQSRQASRCRRRAHSSHRRSHR